MVWPIIRGESYVSETGKSMKAGVYTTRGDFATPPTTTTEFEPRGPGPARERGEWVSEWVNECNRLIATAENRSMCA